VAPPGTKRYLLLRRTVQASVLLLFIAGNAFGWRVLQGNLSSSRFLGSVPLSDPYALLQVLFTGSLTRNARYWVLGLGLVLSPVLGVAAFERLSPVSMLHRGLIYGMGAGWAVVAAVFLFDLFAVRQGFCGHLCPLGAFYALAGRAGVLRVAHREERCSRCERCRDICPEPQVLPLIGRESGFVSSGECTNCGRCIDVCPDDALAFGVRLQYNTPGERKGG
jgi:ferredoxin-type protein NapH